MEKIKLGDSDLNVTPVCFGTWQVGGEPFFATPEKKTAIASIHAALDAGINFIDTAPVYGFGHSEEIVAEAIEGKREEVVLATKCGLVWDEKDVRSIRIDNSPETIRADIERSLTRLKTDYIDLYQVHWPEKDHVTPLEETIEALVQLREEGKIRAHGVCNFNRYLLDKTLRKGGVTTCQNRFSIVWHDRQVKELEFCHENDALFMAYSPLHRGLLSDAYKTNFCGSKEMIINQMGKEEGFSVRYNAAKSLFRLAEKNNVSLSNFALNYTLKHTPVDIVIAGSKNPEHVKELGSVLDFEISESDAKAVSGIIDTITE